MKEINGIKLVDRSVSLACSTLQPQLWIYYAGAVPFLLYFLYFFNAMSVNPLAGDRLVFSSGILTLLFIWMKVWQAVFGLRVYEKLMETQPRALKGIDLLRCTGWQIILGAAGLILIPLALLLAIPFGWCYAFFQTATFVPLVCEKGVVSESIRLSALWPRQNHLMLWIICPISLFVMCCGVIAVPPLLQYFDHRAAMTVLTYATVGILIAATQVLNPFGGMLALNFAAAIFILPQLFRVLLGWETLYSMSPNTLLHPGFIMTVWALCFLCMDPIVKICYVVRLYDQRAIHSGHDLLKRIERAVPLLLLLLALGMPSGAWAAREPMLDAVAIAPAIHAPAFTQAALDKSIRQVLQKPIYFWRSSVSARVPRLGVKKSGFLHRFTDGVKDTVKKIAHWMAKAIRKLLKKPSPSQGLKLHFLPQWLGPRFIMLLAGLAMAVLVAMLFLQRRIRSREHAAEPGAARLDEEPTLQTVSAADNSFDVWENMAKQSLSAGDAKAAIRYLFLSTLSLLGERRIISLRKSRSNRELAREVRRRFPDQTELNGSFFSIISSYEYTWFGTAVPNGERLEKAVHSHRTLKDFVQRHAS